jgi:hypothetical protein
MLGELVFECLWCVAEMLLEGVLAILSLDRSDDTNEG